MEAHPKTPRSFRVAERRIVVTRFQKSLLS